MKDFFVTPCSFLRLQVGRNRFSFTDSFLVRPFQRKVLSHHPSHTTSDTWNGKTKTSRKLLGVCGWVSDRMYRDRKFVYFTYLQSVSNLLTQGWNNPSTNIPVKVEVLSVSESLDMFPSEMGGIGGIFIPLSASPYGSVENGNPQNELIPVDTWVMFSFHSSMKGWEDG